jgi:hypothetical protein
MEWLRYFKFWDWLDKERGHSETGWRYHKKRKTKGYQK